MNANRRRDVVSDLTTLDKDKDGLYLDLSSYADKRRFMEMLAWELDTLQLSNNYIEGELPTDKDLSDSGLTSIQRKILKHPKIQEIRKMNYLRFW